MGGRPVRPAIEGQSWVLTRMVFWPDRITTAGSDCRFRLYRCRGLRGDECIGLKTHLIVRSKRCSKTSMPTLSPRSPISCNDGIEFHYGLLPQQIRKTKMAHWALNCQTMRPWRWIVWFGQQVAHLQPIPPILIKRALNPMSKALSKSMPIKIPMSKVSMPSATSSNMVFNWPGGGGSRSQTIWALV